MRLFGYGRVSTNQQSLDIQIAALKAQGVDDHRLFSDKATGKNMERAGLDGLRMKVEKASLSIAALSNRVSRYQNVE